ncbi:MAG: hypothetical protein U1F43_20220 [Myxococcota bacterium]
MRKVYAARRDACAETLAKELGQAITFRVPAGGMALWFEVDPDLDVDAWAARAAALGGGFPTARWFACDGRPRPAGRIAFAALSEAELRHEVRLLARALVAPAARAEPRRRRSENASAARENG